MKKDKKTTISNFSKEELKQELKKRNEIQNIFKIKNLKNIPDSHKVKVFNELYSSTLTDIEASINKNYINEDLSHFCYENLMIKLFGKDIFKECLNKIGGTEKIVIKKI